VEKTKNINDISKETMFALSEYCINKCKAYCCRKGYLIVNEEQLNLILNNNEKKKQRLINNKDIKEMLNGKFSINFSTCNGCPALSLKTFKCNIYENENRPQTCKDFPIFIVGKKIKISSRCPAKRDNKFFKFEKQAEKLGYEIVEDLYI
jgi:Fe-S-cluster containining protein